jgi:3-hydroxybutyryl-CoA dehydrogenase
VSEITNIAVIGAGTMGVGIAQVAAQAGCGVQLIDVDAAILRRAMDEMARQLDRLVEKGRITLWKRDAAMARIHPLESIRALGNVVSESDTSGVQMVIEAVVERLDVKHKVFQELESAVGKTAILATNTSSLSVSKIAECCAHPERVVGMHFFNPAPIMPLVEVVVGDQSEDRAVHVAYFAAESWGKTPVCVRDTPGFIVNRVARGYYLEALRLLGEGVAGVDEIDQVMKKHGAFKMGPFELMDLVGLDVNLAVSTSVWEQFGKHPRFAPHTIQQKLVEQGHLGRKTGQGFYSYADAESQVPAYSVARRSFSLSPLLSDTMRTFARRAGANSAGSTEQYVFARILGAVLNEAGLAFSDGIASREDIDTAMVKGTNYPKGPLEWVDEIGLNTVRGLLRALNETVADNRYEPARTFSEVG